MLNKSFPVPNNTLLQVSFLGVPKTRRSYSDDISSTHSNGLSDRSMRTLAKLVYSLICFSELCFSFKNLFFEVFSETMCNNVKLNL